MKRFAPRIKPFIQALLLLIALIIPIIQASAASELTIEPITWNVIGLDSNNVNVGPNNFPVGVRVCNPVTSTTTVEDVSATFNWTTANANINLRPGSLNPITPGIDLAPNECFDFYFEVTVNRTSAAYDTSRGYRIDVTGTDSDTGLPVSVNSPTPRELFVEYLISQSRNSTLNVYLGADPIPAGGTMDLVVGNTYDIRLQASTATNGYEQIESFINFPNTIFQINSVTTTYTANDATSPDPDAGSKLYADGCNWENNPNDPNYRTCLGTGKYGGTVDITYNVTIIGGGGTNQTLNNLIYDFSGSSYHYNSDLSASVRFANILNATIHKAFEPKTINPGDSSNLAFSITNPGENPISDVNFSDNLPAGLEIDDAAVTYAGCGSLSPTSLTPGDTSLTFSNISIAGFSSCTIEVSVTGASDGVYINISDNLFIGANDTGSYAEDTLVISSKPPAPSTCSLPVTLATWTMPITGQGSGGPPPTFTTKATDVATALASSSGGTPSIVSGGVTTNAWQIAGGWNTMDDPPSATSFPYFEFSLDTSNYGGVSIEFAYDLEGNGDWASGNNNYVYFHTQADSGSFSTSTPIGATKGSWQSGTDAITYSAPTTGLATTTFRINVLGAPTNKPNASVALDDIIITGCPRPDPPNLSKAFSPASIPEGSTSTLTFTLTNPNSSELTGVEFNDTLPAGLLIASPNGLTQSCTSGSLDGTVAANPGTRSFELSSASIDAGATCTISIDVLGDAAGEYENISGNIASSETGANTTVTGYGVDSLTVIAPPVISKSFDSTFILTGDTASLHFTISNPNPNVALSGVAFSDGLPAGLELSDGTFSVCGGTNNLITTAATDTVALTATTIDAGDTCNFSVTVTGSTIGSQANTTGNVTSTNGGTGNTASATILVKDPSPAVSLLKQIGTTSSGPWNSFLQVGTGSNIYFRFIVENTGDVNLSSVDVSDPASYVDPSTCSWVDGDGDTLSAPFTLPTPDAGDEDHIAYCVLGPVLTSSTVGEYDNTATVSGTYNATTVNDSSTATYANPELTITKNAVPAYYLAAGDSIDYTLQVTNTGFVPLEGPVVVDDDKATDESCPSLSTVGDGDNYLDRNESLTCTASYTITAGDVTGGSVTNIANATVGGVTSANDSETVYLAAMTIDKDTSTPTVGANASVVYSIVVSNTGAYDLTNFQVSDVLPYNNGEYSVANVDATVTSGTINVNPGYDGSSSTTLLVGTDTLLAGATATITIEIQLNNATTGTYDNTAQATTNQTGSIDDDGSVAGDPGTPGAGADPETDEDVTIIAGGTITITKDAIPEAAQDFAFTGSGPSSFDFDGGFNLDDDTDVTLPNSRTFSGLTPGSYSLTEGAVAGWSLTGLSCNDPDNGSSVELSTRTASIDLDAGETVSCTYTNSQLGVIIIVKDSVPNADQDFAFTGSGPSGYDFGGGFSLDDDLDGTLPNSETFPDLLPGSYSLTEGAVSGWDLTDLTCVELYAGSSVDLATRTASIDLDPAETVTCTFENTQQNPALTLVKSITSGDPYDTVGDIVSYEFELTNSGNVTLDGPFTVTDDKATDENCPATATLAPGASITCTASYTITQADLDAGSVTNLASASGSFNGSPITSNQDSETATANRSPSIQVVKEVSVDSGSSWQDANSTPGPSLSPGTDPQFRFTVTNNGNVTLGSLSLSDTDMSSFYESDLSTPCTLPGSLAPGANYVCYGTLTWTAGQHTNTATAEGDFNTTTYSDSDDAHYFGSTASYTITKSVTDVDGGGASGSVDAAGDVISYEVVVENTGNQTITGVSLSDPLPTSVGSPTESISSNGSLDVGETWTWTYTYTATQTDIDNNGGGDGDIDNTATVSSNEIGDTSDSAALPISQSPSLNVVKEVSDDNATWQDSISLPVGDTVYYRVRVENTGNTTLTGLSVTDPACTLTRAADLIGDDDNDFEIGEEWSFTCTVTAAAGSQNNTATAESNETPQDTDSANYFGEDPSLNVVKEVSDDNTNWSNSVNVAVGDIVYYRVQVENTGNINLTNLSVDDGMAGCSLTRGSDLVGDDDSDFEPNEVWVYYCSVTAVAGTQTNTATADTDETPQDSDGAQYFASDYAYTITKSVTDVGGDGASGAVNAAGDVISYEVVVENTGNQTITGVSLSDPLPTSVGSPTESISNNGSLDVGETWTWTYTYTATQTDIDNNGGGDGDIDNTATVSSNEISDTSDSAAVPIAQNPAYTITKSVLDVDGAGAGGSVDAAGDVVTYQVVVENTGNQTITGVSLSDPLPTSVGSPTESISNNGSLDIGETWTWTYTYTATQMDIDNNGGGDGDIDNTATVSSNELNNTSDSAVVPISQSPSFSVVKQVSDDNATWQNSISLLVGDTVYYRVVLENTGNRTLTGVSVIDPACTLTRAADISGDNDNNFEVGEQWAYTCSVTAVAGTQINTATVDTNETGPQSDSADYVGVSPPNISKSFSPGTINAGETSTLTFTITNPNSSTDLLGVEFDDTFPTSPGAMVVALPANASSSCGGTISASPGAGSISFSGATLIAGSNCTVSVDVMAPIDGLYANFSETVTSSNGGTGNRASASLIAGAAIIIDPAVTKTGDPASAQVGDIVTFTLNVFNNGNADATNVVVTDPLPVFLDYVGVSAPGATTTAYAAGTNTVTISYATVSPSDFFTILITTSVNDLGAPPGGTNTVNLVSTSADSDPANNIDDTTITIVVPSELRAPETGFAPDQITSLPVQPENLNYEAYSDISIEIPALGIKSAIVGVPLIEEGWDVTWLWNQVGYLDGTAFPGWNGNSVLTAHVYLPSGLPGPFVDLKQLAWGDQVVVQSYGTRYIFEVRESRLYRPDDRRIIRHEESPWLTLITCQRFDEATGSYKWRRVVRGELVSTEAIQ